MSDETLNDILKTENAKLQSELDAYKIALKYFVDTGGHGASDIADNLLREVTRG